MLAATCCFFNPMKYKRPVENWHRFRGALPHELPLYSIELSFDGEFQTDSTWRVRGTMEDHLMWQKERLLNLAIERVPDRYDKITWLDSDVLFLNDRWVEETEAVLDEKPVAQLFETAVMLDEEFMPASRSWGVGSALAKGLDAARGHAGLAWAARRELFPLLDDHILGLADATMAFAWLGHSDNSFSRRMNRAWRRQYLEWAQEKYDKVQGNVGYVSGDVFHLWHGSRADRKYFTSWTRLAKSGYQPSAHVRLDSNGLWTWAGDGQHLRTLMRQYFETRRDDGV
ncbi:MAG TPA: hypothetical protein VMY37_30740 [Thermoguttaceae bacterium]|nr:hypothetical protein [Thermoguttaceae bacterium]